MCRQPKDCVSARSRTQVAASTHRPTQSVARHESYARVAPAAFGRRDRPRSRRYGSRAIGIVRRPRVVHPHSTSPSTHDHRLQHSTGRPHSRPPPRRPPYWLSESPSCDRASHRVSLHPRLLPYQTFWVNFFTNENCEKNSLAKTRSTVYAGIASSIPTTPAAEPASRITRKTSSGCAFTREE